MREQIWIEKYEFEEFKKKYNLVYGGADSKAENYYDNESNVDLWVFEDGCIEVTRDVVLGRLRKLEGTEFSDEAVVKCFDGFSEEGFTDVGVVKTKDLLGRITYAASVEADWYEWITTFFITEDENGHICECNYVYDHEHDY